MKYLGVDYGAKRVGLAISEEEGKLAFPLIVLNNNTLLIENIKNICQKEKIKALVLGESYNSHNDPNKIMTEIEEFKRKFETETNLPIYFQKEFMTSLYASVPKLKNFFKARKDKVKIEEKNDASAAALILQRYLDKINN